MPSSLYARGLAVLVSVFLASCEVTPESISWQNSAQIASETLQNSLAEQEPVTESIGLYEAMARAIKYNLAYRVEAAKSRLRMAQLNVEHYSMLPSLVATAGYTDRNNVQASSSFNLVTNTPNFGSSTSQEQVSVTKDMRLSWNILDFGLSYVRSLQVADRALIAEELQRKALHTLLEDVQDTYWRAVTYDRLSQRMDRLQSRIEKALKHNRAISSSGKTPRARALEDELKLLEIKRTIKILKRETITAKIRLARLINIKPGNNFKLVSDHLPKTPKELPNDLERMVTLAMHNRSELRENWYQQRINKHEANAIFLELLPGLQVFSSTNHDANSFLLNNNWLDWGAKASWNLVNVFRYPAKRRLVDSQGEVLRAQELALAMAVMTQVHISRARLLHKYEELESADEIKSVQNRLAKQLQIEYRANRISNQELLRKELDTLIAEARYDAAYSNFQSAHANLLVSMGWDPAIHLDQSLSVSQLASVLRYRWSKKGDLEESAFYVADG